MDNPEAVRLDTETHAGKLLFTAVVKQVRIRLLFLIVFVRTLCEHVRFLYSLVSLNDDMIICMLVLRQ